MTHKQENTQTPKLEPAPTRSFSFLNSDDLSIDGQLYSADFVRAAVNERASLTAERDDLLEQLRLRSPSNVERDNQQIMAINNDLLSQVRHKDEALRLAIRHIKHMANWIGKQNAGYSFEILGEDMPGIEAALHPEDKRPLL